MSKTFFAGKSNNKNRIKNYLIFKTFNGKEATINRALDGSRSPS